MNSADPALSRLDEMPRRGVTEFRQLQRFDSLRARLRNAARQLAIFALALKAKIPRGRNGVSLPLYHHVFDDERKDFARHLKFYRNHGEFVSMDDATKMLADPSGIDGNYFAITFDDGFSNCLTNAAPILTDHKAPAIFYIATDYIGKDLDGDWPITRRFFELSGYAMPVEFLSWEGCRELVAAGMTLGSHTCGHPRILNLSADMLSKEFVDSRRAIERETGQPCIHFACPWGRPGLDFDPSRHPQEAACAGYKSFATTERGPNYEGADQMALRRENFRAGDADGLLRHFLSKG